jgi:hypothetical protein
MCYKNDHSVAIILHILQRVVLVFLFIIWGISLLVAHEPESVEEEVLLQENFFSSDEVFFSHIHGVGYAKDGNHILVASHTGIMNYTNGQWIAPDLLAHDFMGFSSVDEGFFSSGHPTLDSDLLNPLGLVKVSGNEKEITSLAFAGVFDFHQMAAGYYSHAIYVINKISHPHLKRGLNYTLDEGKSWTHSGMHRIAEWPAQIAVHPTDIKTVAVTTKKGIYLSQDFGNSFKRLENDKIFTAVTFSPDGMFLVYGHQTIEALQLPERKASSLPSPEFSKGEYINFIAINPMSTNEVVVVSNKKNIYLSKNWGNTWLQIAREGRGLSK